MTVEKHEWRKHEKVIYLPKTEPAIIEIPKFKYFAVNGEGDPNSGVMQDHMEALYSLSYGVSMSYKKGMEPEGFYQYAVYPLEGVWDLNDKAKRVFDEGWSKDDLVFSLMIRQPEFVTREFFAKIKELTKDKKPNRILDEVGLVEITEGKCCQMMHIGSYDDEKKSFDMMEEFCNELGLCRVSGKHREIYLSDPRRTEAEKLKTVLRFMVK